MAAARQTAQVDREVLIAELLSKLSGDSESEATNACAVLVMLSSRDSPPLELLDMVGPVVKLLGSSTPALKQNACAALTAIISGVPGGRDGAAAARAAEAITAIISNADTDVKSASNALETMSALVAEGGLGLDAALVAGAPRAVVEALKRATDPRLQEAATDTACAFASEAVRLESKASLSPAGQEPLRQAGAVAALLPHLSSSSAEARVRGIMGVAMLSGTKEAAKALVETPGAIAAIAGLVRSKEDTDERSIAADLFTSLLGDSELRDRVRSAATAAAPAS